MREAVSEIKKEDGHYRVLTRKNVYQSDYLISAVPVNNTLELMKNGQRQQLVDKVMVSGQLNSAFQMGVGFVPHRSFDAIHHQIHLPEPLPETGSDSIFISLSHPEDTSRTDEQGQTVMSVSTHIPDPASRIIDERLAEEAVINELVKRGFVKKENIVYQHSSTPKSWAKWTGRKWGFVGGYPQYQSIKPWQMLDARLDGHKAYMAGDTVYPGQGIPGVTLSGIIAAEKMCKDWKL